MSPSRSARELVSGSVKFGAKLPVRVGTQAIEGAVVVEKQHAQLRIVRTGKRTDGEVELLSGVAPGESVVIEGAEQLRDGQPITLKS